MSAPDPRPFGPDSLHWEFMGNTLFLSAIGGAFVLQGMHPMISTTTAIHSAYKTDPKGRMVRSLDSMMLWIYGGEAAIDEGRRLRRLHADLQGVDDEGHRYSALDGEAWAWVHATAWVVTPRIVQLSTGRKWTEHELDRLYDEFLHLGEILRVPRRYLLSDRAEFEAWTDHIVEERLERTFMADEAIAVLTRPDLAHRRPLVLSPAVHVAERSAARLAHLLVVGTLPEGARAKLGLSWTGLDERALRLLYDVARPVHARLPERMRYVPLALHARRRARELASIEARALPSFVDARHVGAKTA